MAHLRTTTYAFSPDEPHHSIRRVFSPFHAPHTKRHFCGYCGTPLSSWNESTHREADWIRVNVGSLRNESVHRLKQSLEDLKSPERGPEFSQGALQTPSNSSDRQVMGNPWFEEIVEGSELGRIRRRRGGQTSADGRSKVEWEVVEVGEDEEESLPTSTKRKLNAMHDNQGNDSQMQGAP